MILFDEQTETAVLGICMIAPAAVSSLIAWGVDDECFHLPAHTRMWDALKRLTDSQEELSPEQVARAMSGSTDASDQDRILVANAFANPSPAGGVRNDAERLRDMARRRRWARVADLAREAAATGDESLIADAEKLLATTEQSEDTITPLDLGIQVCNWLADTKPVGVATGMRDLDAAIGGGWRPGDMTVLGAYSGIGKSAILDTWLTYAARSGASTHVYVNEMNSTDRALRMIARETRITSKELMLRNLSDKQHMEAIQAASRLPFGVTDCSLWTAERIARHARACRWDVWAVDLVSNMAYRDEQELSQIINTLASAARNTKTHCILVAQLNRARNIGDTLPRPVSRDLRGSGMFEAQSRNTLMLHRPQTTEGSGDDKLITTELEGTVYVEKATHGTRGVGVEVVFVPESMAFRPLTGPSLQVAA